MATYPIGLYASIPGVEHSTCSHDTYMQRVMELSQLAERYAYTGALIHYNHHTLNPWMLANAIMQHTSEHIPLIAVQPNTMPPFTVASMIASLAFLYGRKVALNVVAGASQTELEQTGDSLDHDQRYVRLQEYIEVIRYLLQGRTAVTYQGTYYKLKKLQLLPRLSADLFPTIFVAGSSPSGMSVAAQVADIAVTHPLPIDIFLEQAQSQQLKSSLHLGIRLGIIARSDADQAWQIARFRFPPSRAGIVRTQMQQHSSSQWIRNLATLADESEVFDEVYWLGAYQSGQSNCPYLVGSYEQVASYLRHYLTAGVQEVLIDGPFSQEDFYHTDQVLRFSFLTPSLQHSSSLSL